MIIIGSLTFIAIVVATLSITLPITLKSRNDKTNENVTNFTDTTHLPTPTSPKDLTSMSLSIRM